jgi:adenylylsulfate kinase
MNRGKCIWITGLPCSGKTTIANQLKKYYENSCILDGDIIRNTILGQDVGFSVEDRKKHILRMGTIAKLMVDSGLTVICSFVSPDPAVREEVRNMFGPNRFFEIYLSTPLEECERRDVKGLYAKARSGEIKNFTGIGAPYNPGTLFELKMDTTNLSIEESVQTIINTPALDPYDDRKALFIGRWNGVFHNGHNHIIQKKLDEGFKVILAIRNVKPDEKNPWTATQVKEMLDYRWKDHLAVETIIIPDIISVEYGRGVGYDVNEIQVTEQIAGISGTECRSLIAEGDSKWKEFVPKEIAEYLTSVQQ